MATSGGTKRSNCRSTGRLTPISSTRAGNRPAATSRARPAPCGPSSATMPRWRGWFVKRVWKSSDLTSAPSRGSTIATCGATRNASSAARFRLKRTASSTASKAHGSGSSNPAPWWQRPRATITATSNLISSMRIPAPTRSRSKRRAGQRKPSRCGSASASISARSDCSNAGSDAAHRSGACQRLLGSCSGRRGAASRRRRLCARSSWPAHDLRMVLRHRPQGRQPESAGRAARPNRLPPGLAVGAGSIGHRTCVRAAAGAWPFHPPGGSADLYFSRGVERRALARRRLFLEYTWPRIHPDVGGRGVLFPCSRRQSLFPRSFFDRLGDLTFEIAAPSLPPRWERGRPARSLTEETRIGPYLRAKRARRPRSQGTVGSGRTKHMPADNTISVALPRTSARVWLLRVIQVLAAACAFLLILPYLLTPLYRVVDPVSTLMLWRGATLARGQRGGVP